MKNGTKRRRGVRFGRGTAEPPGVREAPRGVLVNFSSTKKKQFISLWTRQRFCGIVFIGTANQTRFSATNWVKTADSGRKENLL